MSDTAKPRLLLVDDEASITSTAPSILRDLADVDVAHSVDEARDKLAAHTYAGVVLDLVLDGDASMLHDALSSREIPTLLTSGKDAEALARTADARGWPYAAKPIAPAVLRSLVAELLGVDVEPTQRGVRPVRPPPAPRPGGPPMEVGGSLPALPRPVAVQALDKLIEAVAILAVAYLAVAGKVSGELAVGVIAAIAGVGTIGRAVTGRQVGAASAAVALAAMLHASPAASHAAPIDRPRPHETPPAATLLTLVMLLTLVVGCASMPDAPAASITKVRGWWGAVCSAGDEALSLAERTVTALPRDDAGPGDASRGALGDASVSAESDGGDQ